MLRLPRSWMRSIRSLATVGCFWFANSADAATFTVTNVNDSGAGSLRDAITAANNAGAGTHNINFGAGAKGTISLATPLPVLANNININGPGAANLTVSGASTQRVFFADTGTIQISGLTIASGSATGGRGGDSVQAGGGGGGGGGMGAGGGLYVNSTANVSVSGTVFQNNRAIGGTGGATTRGGASGAGGGGLNGNGGTVINGFGGAGGGGLYGAGADQTSDSGGGGGGQVTAGGTDGTNVGGGGGGILTPGATGTAGGAGGTGPTGVIGGQGGTGAGAGGNGLANGGGGGGGFVGIGGNGGRNGGGGGAGLGPGGNGGDHGGGGGGFAGTGGSGGFGGGGGGGDVGGLGGFGGGSGGSATIGQGGGGGSGFGGAVFIREGGTLTVIDGDIPTGNSVTAGVGGAGTISSGANGTSAGGSVFLNNSNLSFLVNGSNIATVGNDIAGNGNLSKDGTGTLDLYGANTYAGTTTVNGGRLNVRGSIADYVLVNSGGTLGGSGSVGRTDVVGRIAPGNSIGTLTVNGSYTQYPGSTYEVEINGAGQSDLIQVNGSATILGGTILVVPAPDTYNGGTRYVIVRARDGVSGQYDAMTVTPGITAREFGAVYTANEVFLAVLFTRQELVSNAQTFNQRSVAATLANPNIPSGLVPIYNSLRVLTVGELGQALDQLSGAIHGSALSYTRMAALQTNLLLSDQQHATLFRCGVDEIAPGYSSWLQSRGALGQVNGAGSTTSYSVGSGGFLTGIDRWLSESSRVGFYTGYNFWDMQPKGLGDRAAVNGFDVGFDASQTYENYYALGNIGYGYNHYDVKRQINYLSFEGYPESRYGANLFNVGAEFGGAWQGDGFAIKPLAALQYQYISTNRFEETGPSAANLNGDAQNAMALWGSLGSRFSYCVDYYGLFMQARAQVRWIHDYLGDDRASLMRFDAGGAPFQVQGARTGQNFYSGSLGFSLGADALRFNFDYSILASSRQLIHLGNAGLEMQW